MLREPALINDTRIVGRSLTIGRTSGFHDCALRTETFDSGRGPSINFGTSDRLPLLVDFYGMGTNGGTGDTARFNIASLNTTGREWIYIHHRNFLGIAIGQTAGQDLGLIRLLCLTEWFVRWHPWHLAYGRLLPKLLQSR
jgi:hypothetical protein